MMPDKGLVFVRDDCRGRSTHRAFYTSDRARELLAALPLTAAPGASETSPALRLRQEPSGFVHFRALTVSLLGQDHKLVVECTGFLFLTSQFGGTSSAIQALKTIGLTTL